MRQLATIQKIEEIQPIKGADSIEKVRVKDWWCVAKKGEFKVGDLCVYFEIDSLVPSSNPVFDFLKKGTKEKKMVIDGKEYTGSRLKTIKLRGQISQGLALPLSMLASALGDEKLAVGDDLSERLSVVKYEAPVPAELAGKVKGNFPGFIPKTDEERVQNLSRTILNHQGELFYITEKLDGTSCSFYKKDGVLGVCSRNLDLLETEGNTHWAIAKELNMSEMLPEGYSVQGEIIGEGIQQNPLKQTGRKFYAFNIYDFVKGKYLDFSDFVKFCGDYKIKTVPIIDEKFLLNISVAEIIKMADGKSVLNSNCEREGIVFRPLIERVEELGGNKNWRLSFKTISNEYLLNEK